MTTITLAQPITTALLLTHYYTIANPSFGMFSQFFDSDAAETFTLAVASIAAGTRVLVDVSGNIVPLYDELSDTLRQLHATGEQDDITVDTALLTTDQRKDFVEGWTAYGGDANAVMPWDMQGTAIRVFGDDAYRWGATYLHKCSESIKIRLAEDLNVSF